MAMFAAPVREGAIRNASRNGGRRADRQGGNGGDGDVPRCKQSV
jgi:hypothetical protein